ncbi:MAG TPA: Na+/H+ antiporter subunit E [Pseudonocardiaceae bacterium]
MLAKIVEFTVWWAVLLLVWLATLNAFSFEELGLAAGLALPGAFAACAARIATGGRWRVDPRWIRWLLVTPWAILHDTVSVLRLAAGPDRPEDDSIEAITLDNSEDDGGHEALATLVLSTSPGSVVVDAEQDRLLVHRLPIGRTRQSEVVRR